MIEVLVALIGGTALVAANWIVSGRAVRPVKRDAAAAREAAEAAVEQTLPVSNGFAAAVKDHIAQSAADAAERRTHDRRVEQLLVNFDTRLTRLEDRL